MENRRSFTIRNLYSLANIVYFIKSRRLRWTGHVARMKERVSCFTIFISKSTGRKPIATPIKENVRHKRPEEGG
jgi:hypothetical protein